MADGFATFPIETIPGGLTWSSDDSPGLSRKPSGTGYSYCDTRDRAITEEKVLERIHSLAIPPAWTDVWICPRASGHIQATGRDARGRKQYRYHDDWSRHASTNKFDRLSAFAAALPRLRKRIETDMARCGPCRDKVLATAVQLLEITLIRVGNAEYARTNRSYGLTTLHKRHLAVDGAGLTFAFRGKSGVEHSVSVRDRRLATVIRGLRDLPGQSLFKYRGADGELCPVTSDDVNAYIREAMGEQFSAKDFRTWAGTVSAARALRTMGPPASATDAARKIRACVKATARLLGNTPTVCRASYIHPAVLTLYQSGALAEILPGSETKGFDKALARSLRAAR